MGLWNSKAQKVQWGVAFLCLSLPPTSCLPALPGASCRGQEVGDSQALTGYGEEAAEGRFAGSVFKSNHNSRSFQQVLGMPSICPLFDTAGTASEAGPMSCVLFSFTGSTETGGEIWQVELIWAAAQIWPLHFISDLSLLFGACRCCLSAHDSTGGADIEWQGWEARGAVLLQNL